MKNSNAYVSATMIGLRCRAAILTGPAVLSAVGSAGGLALRPHLSNGFDLLRLRSRSERSHSVSWSLISCRPRRREPKLARYWRELPAAHYAEPQSAPFKRRHCCRRSSGRSRRVAGTYAGYYLRKHAVERHGIPRLRPH